MATVLATPADLLDNIGADLGASDWIEITQEQVNLFADATGDHQWIHVDPERAKNGPFGQTIAHGYLTLSLVPVVLNDLVQITGAKAAVNYGLNKVRFPSPVPVGSKVRATGTVLAAVQKSSGVEATFTFTFEVEGGQRPACVAESVVIFQ